MKIRFDNYELSPKEARVVEDALDLHCRFHQGQFAHLAHLFWTNMAERIDKRNAREVKKLLEEAQVVLHGNTNQYWKITSNFISRDALVACRLGLILEDRHVEASEVTKYMGFNNINIDKSEDL